MAEHTPTTRLPAHLVGVKGARAYGLGGNVPADAVVTAIRPHGRGTQVEGFAEAPFVQAYKDRPTCQGTRTDGNPCKAKAEPGKLHCLPHDPEA